MKIAPEYQKIIAYVRESGKRIASKAGNIADIGVTKAYLTEEDIAIERGFKKIIKEFGDNHTLFAEEENEQLLHADNVWVADPISGTATFIKGLPHYAIVISHVYHDEPVFAAVYDPSMDELYTAFKGKGAFFNGTQFTMPTQPRESDILLKYASQWKRQAASVWPELAKQYMVWVNMNSVALNYCQVAHGKYDGVITLAKDVFPEYAGSLIMNEAGGLFTNNKGAVRFHPSDRVFVGGNPHVHKQLLTIASAIHLQA